MADLMLYAQDPLLVDSEVSLVCVRECSHAGLHSTHEVRPRHPPHVAVEAHEGLRALGEVDLAGSWSLVVGRWRGVA